MTQSISLSVEKIGTAKPKDIFSHRQRPFECVLRSPAQGCELMLIDLASVGAVAPDENSIQPMLVNTKLNIELDSAALDLVVDELGGAAGAPFKVLGTSTSHAYSPYRREDPTTLASRNKPIAMTGAADGQFVVAECQPGRRRLGHALIRLWQALQRRESTFGQILDMSAACGLDGRRVLADHFHGGVR